MPGSPRTGSPTGVDVDALVEGARAGRPRAVARLITLIENASPSLRGVMRALASDTGRATVIGLTGSPGVGKSTTTTALVGALRARGQRVGVLAVDPSSPFTGGALLGDRVRMQQHALDPEVFIRSMATRGHLGGLAAAAPQALRVFDAAGCDTVIVETVGVGQSEVEIAGLADVTLVLVAPGMGDGIQAAKAGILEVGDLFVVNKADRDGAQAVVRDLRNMVAMADRGPEEWKPPVITTVGARPDRDRRAAGRDRPVRRARPGRRRLAAAHGPPGRPARSRHSPSPSCGAGSGSAATRGSPPSPRPSGTAGWTRSPPPTNWSGRLGEPPPCGVASRGCWDRWDRKRGLDRCVRHDDSTGRMGRVTMKWVKKILFALVVLFAGYYLITRPEDAADAVRGVFLWVAGGDHRRVPFLHLPRRLRPELAVLGLDRWLDPHVEQYLLTDDDEYIVRRGPQAPDGDLLAVRPRPARASRSWSVRRSVRVRRSAGCSAWRDSA